MFVFFIYTIEVIAILLGAGWDRSGPDSDRKSSFSGPRRGLRGRPGTSGGARRVPARPNLENRRQLLRNDPLRPPFLDYFWTPTPPQPPGPYTLEYLRFEGIPPFAPHASCPPGSADSQACGLCRRPRKESDIVFAELFMFIPIFIIMFIFTFTLMFVFIFNVNVHVHGQVHVRVHVHFQLMFIFRFFI